MKTNDFIEKLNSLYLTSDESIIKVTFSKKGKTQTLFGQFDHRDSKPNGHLVFDTGDEERLTRIPIKAIVNVELVDKRPFVALLNATLAEN